MIQQWDYEIVRLGEDDTIAKTLRLWGDNGWEAWHIEYYADSRCVFFKRPKRDITSIEYDSAEAAYELRGLKKSSA